jgi:2-isopropylmalate synthase
MAVTRVSISPIEGGPNDNPTVEPQSGISKNRKFSGSGSDTDIITSSARAYVSALNKLLTSNARRLKVSEGEGEVSTGGVGNAIPTEKLPVSQV